MTAPTSPRMQTFRARSVTAALQEVQRALGPDAIVVSVRQITPTGLLGALKEPQVEVMAMPGGSGDTVPPESPAPGTPPADTGPLRTQAAGPESPEPQPPAEAQPAGSEGAAGQEELKKRFPVTPPGLLKLQEQFLRQSLEPQLVKKLITGCLEVLPPRLLKDDDYLRRYLSMQLQALLQVNNGQPASGREVLCLAGTSGVGKTSLCAKIAATAAQNGAPPVAWVCADTVTAGAIAQARQYASALQIPLHTPYTPQELADTVAGLDDGLVLVDLQSFNPYQEKSIVQFADYLTALSERTLLWVFSAATKGVDLQRAYQVLKPFGIDGLAVSHLDDTGSFGSVFNLASRSRLPLYYFSTGARVPEDLHPARRETLVQAIMQEKWPVIGGER